LIGEDAKIIVKNTGREFAGMHGLGTPEDFEVFQKSEFYRSQMKS
jgi:hypothetical protein